MNLEEMSAYSRKIAIWRKIYSFCAIMLLVGIMEIIHLKCGDGFLRGICVGLTIVIGFSIWRWAENFGSILGDVSEQDVADDPQLKASLVYIARAMQAKKSRDNSPAHPDEDD